MYCEMKKRCAKLKHVGKFTVPAVMKQFGINKQEADDANRGKQLEYWFNLTEEMCDAALSELPKQYKTSITATAIRYATLNISPCMVIKWHWQGYVWKRFSNSMFRRKFMIEDIGPGQHPLAFDALLRAAQVKAPFTFLELALSRVFSYIA